MAKEAAYAIAVSTFATRVRYHCTQGMPAHIADSSILSMHNVSAACMAAAVEGKIEGWRNELYPVVS